MKKVNSKKKINLLFNENTCDKNQRVSKKKTHFSHKILLRRLSKKLLSKQYNGVAD